MGAREHVLKSRGFLYVASWAKHFREIPSHRKSSYLKRFPSRFLKVSPYLDVARVYLDVESVVNMLKLLNPCIVLVDNKLLHIISGIARTIIVPENKVVYRHHRVLITLADNLANYFRILLKSDPKRFREELKKFEK